mmetsp:Transcript_46060/g.98473  ORF Transcript_46060/g.98473 Transcript_46060/m.98473 type:complete len:380 (-) Transcript_46060:5-1144(-)
MTHRHEIEFTIGRARAVSESTVGEIIPSRCALDVGLGSIGPEDWPHTFSLPILGDSTTPRHGLSGSLSHTQTINDLHDAGLQVQGVEMQSRHTILQELLAHLHPQLNSVSLHLRLIFLDRLQGLRDLLWDVSLTESCHALEAVVRLDRHDTRQDWDRDAHVAASLHKPQEFVTIVEQLGDNQISTGLRLLLHPLHVILLVRRLQMVLRVPSNCDAEIVPEMLPDVLHQIRSVRESTDRGCPILLSSWRVTSQGQDVADPHFLALLQSLMHGFHRDVGACQMHHHIQAVVLQSIGADRHGLLRSRSTSTPGHIDPHRVQRSHSVKSIIQIGLPGSGLGWEILKTVERLARILFLESGDLLIHFRHGCNAQFDRINSLTKT